MKILAIETSCDDTGIAVLEQKNGKFKTLSNIVSSQEIHQNYGGVFPMMAKREHQRNLLPVILKALKESKLLKIKNLKFKNQNDNAKFKIIEKVLERESDLSKNLLPFLKKYEKPDVDMIAVTNGPGLEPCLWVGVNFARALSYFWDIPIVPVNHIEAHILVNLLKNKKVIYPAIALVVSGGHTQLILMKGIGKYEIIGETRDDAAGECFDKCAKILGLGYPGGPIISKIAQTIQKPTIQRPSLDSLIELPRPMINSKDYDFSFSGLKTAVLYKVRDQKENPSSKISSGSQHFVSEMCFEIQQSIIDVLIKKTINAVKSHKVKTIILGGGVSANQELRKQFTKKSNIPVIFPEPKLSTDNGLMIAVAGYFNRNKEVGWQKLRASANLRISN